jgi:hypothetical protein
MISNKFMPEFMGSILGKNLIDVNKSKDGRLFRNCKK